MPGLLHEPEIHDDHVYPHTTSSLWEERIRNAPHLFGVDAGSSEQDLPTEGGQPQGELVYYNPKGKLVHVMSLKSQGLDKCCELKPRFLFG